MPFATDAPSALNILAPGPEMEHGTVFGIVFVEFFTPSSGAKLRRVEAPLIEKLRSRGATFANGWTPIRAASVDVELPVGKLGNQRITIRRLQFQLSPAAGRTVHRVQVRWKARVQILLHYTWLTFVLRRG